jgi:DUF971 family protein
MSAAPWPTDLAFDRAQRQLRVTFDDGHVAAISFEKLRVESPSAEVQGHGGPKANVTGKADVGILEAHAVGRYAVRIVFDDGHETGIYSWAYLRELAG